jgi:phage host-nuclease inhibitor protein Gam
MTRARSKTRGVNLPVPQSRDQAAASIRRIGELTRELTRREADMNDALARIKAQCEQAAEPLREEVKGLTEGLKTWAEANRVALTDGGRVKFADLGTGVLRWRLRPPKVSLPRDVAAVIERLRALNLPQFVRTKEEVDREAMLADPEAARRVPGVRIASEGEDFVVEPFEAELAEVA